MDYIPFSNQESSNEWDNGELFENLKIYETKNNNGKTEQSNKQQVEQNYEVYRGIIHHFSSPYHLYLRVDDLNKPTIRFVVFSTGKTKIIMSGMFSFLTGKFYVFYSCDYQRLKRLNQYIQLLKEDYINTLIIVKNRVDKRLSQFMGTATNFNYPQTKLWLTFQPESRYYETRAVADRLKRLEPTFVQQLYDSNPSLRKASELERELMYLSLMGDDKAAKRMTKQITKLRREAIDELDNQVADAEYSANFVQQLQKDKTIIDVSQRFYRWISFHPIEHAQPCTDESEVYLIGEDMT